MILTVASGKGGTGKTTLAVGLAQVAAQRMPGRVVLLDLDVEAPNAALFLRPEIQERHDAVVPIPEVDPALCDHCGRCVELCAYNALADLGSSLLVLPDLCMGCGVCVRHCPTGALSEVPHVLGAIEAGVAGDLRFAEGRLQVGRAQPTPIIREVKRRYAPAGSGDLVVLDAPPGASCPVMEAARGSDFVLLVAEPSVFGIHDLEKAAGALRDAMGLSVGVVINRSTGRDEAVEAFCEQAGLPVLLKIPFDRRIAAAYAEGRSLPEALPAWGPKLLQLLDGIEQVRVVA